MSSQIDITEFDAIGQCAAGHEIELKHMDGVTGTGVFLTVQGRHSDEVAQWVGDLTRKLTLEAQMAARRGKTAEPKSLKELREQNIAGASIRSLGWRGVKQDFDRELLKVALRKNPHWVDQIVEASDDLGNFLKVQPTP